MGAVEQDKVHGTGSISKRPSQPGRAGRAAWLTLAAWLGWMAAWPGEKFDRRKPGKDTATVQSGLGSDTPFNVYFIRFLKVVIGF